jgi:ADP-heptose:LPS heptosyltransferase
MHLASAVGTKVVGVFGITDPAVTGPVGREGVDHEIVCGAASDRSRDIARNSKEAREHLAAIEPDVVVGRALKLMS